MFAYDLTTEETIDVRDELARRRFDKRYGFDKSFTLEDIPANEYGARFFATQGTPEAGVVTAPHPVILALAGVVTAPNQVILALMVGGFIEAIEEAKAEMS